MKVCVGVSRRHVHLNPETYKILFGDEELVVRNYLNQPGQFASTSTVDLKINEKIVEHVRLVGPLRTYNQVELSNEECNYLGINPPRRQSGDLENTSGITIVNKDKVIHIESGVIKAERHIHLTKETAMQENLADKEEVHVYKEGHYICNAFIKITDPGYNELHIDTCEEIEFNLHTGDIVEIIKE